jgi:hypothetical protein
MDPRARLIELDKRCRQVLHSTDYSIRRQFANLQREIDYYGFFTQTSPKSWRGYIAKPIRDALSQPEGSLASPTIGSYY